MSSSSLVARYAHRLGLDSSEEVLRRRAEGTPAEVIDLIDELLSAHVRSICFENLDVIAVRAAGEPRGIPIELDSLTAKLLDAGRGGYCHEHAILIRAVLTELGLSAYPILARVHLGEGRTSPGGLTHQATVVDLDGRRYLVDPGFGGGTPEAALAFDAEAGPRMTEHGEHRLVPADTVLEPTMRAEADWALQSRTSADQEFRTVYAFADIAREQADLEVSNWFTATKPSTRFTGAPVVARALDNGGKVSLEGRHLRSRRPGSEPELSERTLTDSAEFAAVLGEDFGFDLDRSFTDPIWDIARRS
ncbi:arylamine N-acetyltransferase family protein [Brevibacterium spongiae]|uniref:Arylamine N-acetyltransferase n=1 Tax=Brevibacterium spongiae TaxID=2909672 RepID=A0ABY5SQE7_9MICO|nr:arylamine N-acetyltransferase [Brevibacterium spongiae]UVI36743.1 arylamine N-acetyltransferase [Brevibacterium spongiae]